MSRTLRPLTRQQDLIVQAAADKLLVFDKRTDKAFFADTPRLRGDFSLHHDRRRVSPQNWNGHKEVAQFKSDGKLTIPY